MMKRWVITSALSLVVALPIAVSAVASLQASSSVGLPIIACTADAMQCPDGTWVGRTGPNCEFICGGQTPGKICPKFARTLVRGMRGDDVAQLQAYFGVSQTGFFGPLTQQALVQFQLQEGISPIGILGPLTRGAFARRCGTISQNFSASPTFGSAPLSVNFNYVPSDDSAQYHIEFGDGQGQLMSVQQIYCIRAPCISPSLASHTYTSSGTYTASVSRYIACLYTNPRCMIVQPPPLGRVTITVTNGSTAGAPSISGIDGPTLITLGQQGTWSVRVSDSSGYLSYSVRWGDEPQQIYAPTASAGAIQSTGTFTHTYSSPGTFQPTFTVTNGNGQSASASVSVYVEGGTSGTGILTGHLSIGPLCPVETYPPDPNCRPSAGVYASHRIFVYGANGTTYVTAITADIDGNYYASLPGGSYQLRIENAGGCSGSGGQYSCYGLSSAQGMIPVAIVAGSSTIINISVDTGIR